MYGGLGGGGTLAAPSGSRITIEGKPPAAGGSVPVTVAGPPADTATAGAGAGAPLPAAGCSGGFEHATETLQINRSARTGFMVTGRVAEPRRSTLSPFLHCARRWFHRARRQCA